MGSEQDELCQRLFQRTLSPFDRTDRLAGKVCVPCVACRHSGVPLARPFGRAVVRE